MVGSVNTCADITAVVTEFSISQDPQLKT